MSINIYMANLTETSFSLLAKRKNKTKFVVIADPHANIRLANTMEAISK